MKKSSVVILTIVAALAISSCAVQKTTENLGPPDPVYAEQVSDTTRQQMVVQPQPNDAQPQVYYNYYYRSYFWDNLYRVFCPQGYYTAISRPGFVPRHKRPVRGEIAHNSHPSRHSGRRDGFGHHGSNHVAHS
jgi:hypothetical protein